MVPVLKNNEKTEMIDECYLSWQEEINDTDSLFGYTDPGKLIYFPNIVTSVESDLILNPINIYLAEFEDFKPFKTFPRVSSPY